MPYLNRKFSCYSVGYVVLEDLCPRFQPASDIAFTVDFLLNQQN